MDGGGNMDKNPIFIKSVDPSTTPTTAGNLHLQNKSPAIDKGKDEFVADVDTDLDGLPRKVDGDGNGTRIVDMGAYEYSLNSFLPFVKR